MVLNKLAGDVLGGFLYAFLEIGLTANTLSGTAFAVFVTRWKGMLNVCWIVR
jgi:hypothetical protein